MLFLKILFFYFYTLEDFDVKSRPNIYDHRQI